MVTLHIIREEYFFPPRHFLLNLINNELRQMFEHAGFEIEANQGDYTEAEVTEEHDVIVFIC